MLVPATVTPNSCKRESYIALETIWKQKQKFSAEFGICLNMSFHWMCPGRQQVSGWCTLLALVPGALVASDLPI